MGGARLKRALLIGAVVSAAGLAVGGAGAAAQAPPAYGGGLFGEINPKGYYPTVGVTFEQRGDMLALRFDTTLLCGRDTYQVSGHKVVPAPGGHAEANGRSSFALARGRVRFSWSLSVDVGPTAASGVLDIRGTRRRRQSCTHKPTRNFQAKLATAPSGAQTVPPAGALYLGLSGNRARGGLRLPVLLRITPSGKRVAGRWSASARCRRGAPEPLINLTPPTVVRGDGSFSRSERFRQVFADTVVRYRVLFRGHFTSDGAAGALRLRARVYGPKGRRLLTRCDTGLRQWTALGPVDAAPAGSGAPGAGGDTTGSGGAGATGDTGGGTTTNPPPSEPRWVDAASWSFAMTSDSGEYVGQGGSYSYSTADGQNRGIVNNPGTVSFQIFLKDGGDWGGSFYAPPGQTLTVGTTYTADGTAQGAGLGISGMGRGCGGQRGTFTFDALERDSAGDLRTAKVRFEQHCEGSTKSLRGTWEFHAP